MRVWCGGHAVPQLQSIRQGSSAAAAEGLPARRKLERFPYVWCNTCKKIQPMIFDVVPADERNDHDAADIVCNECKSIMTTLHAVRR